MPLIIFAQMNLMMNLTSGMKMMNESKRKATVKLMGKMKKTKRLKMNF